MDSFTAQRIRWRDYSKDSFTGDVFTLTVRDGGYLIAGLSTFVGFVGPAVWTFVSFALHQVMAQNARSADGVHFQSQVILRHPSTAIAAVIELVLMCFAWRRNKKIRRVQKLKRRCIIIALPALLIFAAFTVIGILVSSVAAPAYRSNNILVKPIQCGYWAFNRSSVAGEAAEQTKNAKDTLNARAYARDCYQSASILASCSLYPQANISYSHQDVSCPFEADPLGQDACLYAQNQAFQLDTGFMNSNGIFGINTAPSQQLEVKKVLTCSPFHASNYINQSLEDASLGGYVINNFYLGPLQGSAANATYSYNTHATQDRIGFQLFSVYTLSGSAWHPVSALNVPNNDVSAFFLSQNSIKYELPVTDIWFKATVSTAGPYRGQDQYEPDQKTNVLACAEQYQLRSPTTGARTVLGGYTQLAKEYNQIGLNAYEEAIATRFILALQLSSTFDTVTFLGQSALLASDNVVELIGTSLAANQWQLEVQGWFETSLARMQWFMLEWVANTADLGQHGYIVSPDRQSNKSVDIAAVHLCSLQRVRNTGRYQTFSFAGVMIIACIGSFLILVSWTVEWLVRLIRRKRRSKHQWRETVRIADGKFQLLRKNLLVDTAESAFDNIHDTENAWDGVGDMFPVAKREIKFLTPQVRNGDYYYDAGQDHESPQDNDGGPEQDIECGDGHIKELTSLQTASKPELSDPIVSRLSGQDSTSTHEHDARTSSLTGSGSSSLPQRATPEQDEERRNGASDPTR